MSRPVEEWLKSFQCEEYADNFDLHGYKTLESLRMIDADKLPALGIRSQHMEIIIQELSNLGVPMPCYDYSPSRDEGSSSVASQHKVVTPYVIKLASLDKSTSQVGQTSAMKPLVTVTTTLQQPLSNVTETSPSGAVPRRIIVIPMRNKDAPSSPGKRSSPVKATCFVSNQPISTLANVSNYSAPVTDHSRLSTSAVPYKSAQLPVAQFIMDSSSSSSSGTDDEVEDFKESPYKLLNLNSQSSVPKSVLFSGVGSDKGSTDVSVCENSCSGAARSRLANSSGSDQQSKSYNMCTYNKDNSVVHGTNLESSKTACKSPARTYASSPSRGESLNLNVRSQKIPKLLLKAKPASTSSSTVNLSTGSPIFSTSCNTESSLQKQPTVGRESAFNSGNTVDSCKNSAVKMLPGNATYSCVVTSSDGLSKIILIPASSNLKHLFCSPVRSDKASHSVMSGITSSPAVCCTVSTANRPAVVSSIPIILTKSSAKVVEVPSANALSSYQGVTRTNDAGGLKNVPIQSCTFSEGKNSSFVTSGKWLVPSPDGCSKIVPPFTTLSSNFPTSARFFLMRKVEDSSSSWTNDTSDKLNNVDLKLVGSRPSKTSPAIVSDDESSDNDSVLILDAETLLPADKSPTAKRSAAKEKVILLNHNKNPVRTIRTRKSLGNSKENGVVEELGRGKRKRKSKLASRFLESFDHDESAVIDKIVKPTNANKLTRAQNRDSFSPVRGKKNGRRNSEPLLDTPKRLSSQTSKAKSVSVSPKERGTSVAEKSPRKHFRNTEYQLNSLPTKSRRVSKKPEKGEREASRSRSLSSDRSKTRSQSQTSIKNGVFPDSCLLPVIQNGSLRVLPSDIIASVNNAFVSHEQQSTDSAKCLSEEKQSLSASSVSYPNAPLSPKIPLLNKANKSMKMDVTNENGVIESLVVEIVDITSSEDEEGEKYSMVPPSGALKTPQSAINLSKTFGSVEVASLERPVVKISAFNTVHRSVAGVDVQSTQNRNSSIVSFERRPIKPLKKLSPDLTVGLRAPTSQGCDVKRTVSASYTGQDLVTRRLSSSTALDKNTVISSCSSLIFPNCNVTAANSATSPCSVSIRSGKLCLTEENKDSDLRQNRCSVANLASLPRPTTFECKMAATAERFRSSSNEKFKQQVTASCFMDSSAKSVVNVEHGQRVSLGPSKMTAHDNASVEGDLSKLKKKRTLLKVAGSRGGKGVARKRKRNLATNSLADDDDYTDQVKRLNRVYGANLKRTRPLMSSSKQSKLETEAVGKTYTGPVVRIRGQKEQPLSCLVVAGECDVDEEMTTKPKKKHSHSDSVRLPTVFNLDDSVPWLCVFCHRGSNYRSLGDLFGPYYCKMSVPAAAAAVSKPIAQASKEKRKVSVNKSPEIGQSSKLQHQRKFRIQKYAPVALTASTDSSNNINDVKSIDAVPSEIWVHEECAVWTSGIYMLGSQLQGLEDAAIVAIPSVCSICQTNGATLGCYMKGCFLKYHFFCARNAGCAFNEENFTIFCPKHKNKKTKMMSSTVSV